MLKIWWIWKIEIWSEEVVDGHRIVPYQPGASFFSVEGGGGGGWKVGVNYPVVFPTHFNLNDSFLKLRQISLLFIK